MNKIFKKQSLLFVVALTLCMVARADYSQDSGRITQLFTNSEGAVAVTLDGGFSSANAAKQCPNGDGNWAGVITANPILKATLLMAKSNGSVVVVTTSGCEAGWLKIIDMFVK